MYLAQVLAVILTTTVAVATVASLTKTRGDREAVADELTAVHDSR